MEKNRAHRAYKLVHEYLITCGSAGATLDEIVEHHHRHIVPLLNKEFPISQPEKANSHATTQICMAVASQPISILNGRWYDTSALWMKIDGFGEDTTFVQRLYGEVDENTAY